jgi:hypothetical protein
MLNPLSGRNAVVTRKARLLAVVFGLGLLASRPADAQDKALVGLIPRAKGPITLDGKLDEWEGAFVTPVHVGHPDFANRFGHFLFLWDDENLYIGQRCLDGNMAHVGRDDQIWNGDAVEFYLDTRRGDAFGGPEFTAGTLHMFWTPFTGAKVQPRLQVRPFKTNPRLTVKGAEVAARTTKWGYTAEFKVPWANFPKFAPKVGEVISIDCELCSSDGGPRVDRTFVYSGPASVGTPATFGRVQLVDKLDLGKLQPFGRALLPLSLNQSANYPWLYATVGVSPTIAAAKATKLEGKLRDAKGAVKKTSTGAWSFVEAPEFALWRGEWELFDLPPGTYTLELTAYGKGDHAITSRTVRLLHGE